MPGVRSAFGFQRDCMKRLLFILFLVLVAAGVNAIMAVVCASLPFPVEFDARRTATLRKQHWASLDAKGDAADNTLHILGAYRAFGRKLHVIRPDVDEPEMIFENYVGWPLSIFTGVERVVTLPPDAQGRRRESRELNYALQLKGNLKVHGPLIGTTPAGIQAFVMSPLGLTPHPTQVLPLRPVTGGFIINTLFYFLLIIAVPVLWMLGRGTYYLFRGSCPRCGYDLRHSPPDRTACPECGRVTKPGSVSPV